MTSTASLCVAPSSELLEQAVLGLVHGFAFVRSRAHPYVAERIGPVWVLRDAPRRRGNYRREEWIACNVPPPPEEVDRIARQHTRGRFAVCAICPAGESDEPLRRGYKALGYRLGTTEAMMAHALRHIPRRNGPATIRRVATPELAEQFAKARKQRPVSAEHLRKDSPIRHYVAMVEDHLVGWVSSIRLGRAAWCSSLRVQRPFRRRGIGAALMCRMLRDDRASGAQVATLTASHSGAMLYPTVGYQRVGTLLLYTTPRRAKP